MLIFMVFETFLVPQKSKKKSHFKENLYSWIVSGCETPPDLFAVKFYNFWPEGKFLRWSGDEFSSFVSDNHDPDVMMMIS